MAKHGRYKIVRKVADGGMAEIFLATQLGREGFQKPVILKRIHSTIYGDPQFRNMFIDEAHISMSLSHSNIVQILDIGLAGGRYFLVLELVDGWDLGRILQRSAAARIPLSRELGLYMTAEICRALSYAHGKTQFGNPLGIVHRDVSPHNVLVSEQGEVKLTDFGIAKAMNKREHTGTGVVKGKVAFMSPEQALGRPIDARSDVFSLGTVLYQLMTGVRPFDAGTDLETLLRVQKADFRLPAVARPDMQPELVEIIERAMRLDPAERYQTADEMLTDVERVLRSVFRPVGQTELKRWLAELSSQDGVPSIGKALGQAGASARVGTGELEGKDVVLNDSEGEQAAGVGEETTSLAILGPPEADGMPRLSRHRPEIALPFNDDEEGRPSGRHPADLSLPIPDDEGGPPGRRMRRKGGRGLSILFVGVLLVGGAAVTGSFLGARVEQQKEDTGEPKAATTGGGGDVTGVAVGSGAGLPDAGALQVDAEPPPEMAAGPKGMPAATPTGTGTEEKPSLTPPDPSRAASGHKKGRGSPSSRAPEYTGRGIIELRNMMHPDPSLPPPGTSAPADIPPSPPTPAPVQPAPPAENP